MYMMVIHYHHVLVLLIIMIFLGYFSIFSWLDFYVNSILDNKSFHRFSFSRTKNCQKSDEKIFHVQGQHDNVRTGTVPSPNFGPGAIKNQFNRLLTIARRPFSTRQQCSKLERLVEFYDGTENAGKVLRNLVYIKF